MRISWKILDIDFKAKKQAIITFPSQHAYYYLFSVIECYPNTFAYIRICRDLGKLSGGRTGYERHVARVRRVELDRNC